MDSAYQHEFHDKEHDTFYKWNNVFDLEKKKDYKLVEINGYGVRN